MIGIEIVGGGTGRRWKIEGLDRYHHGVAMLKRLALWRTIQHGRGDE
jgi:hypothetical protein